MVAMKRMRAFATFDDYLAAQTPRNQVGRQELLASSENSYSRVTTNDQAEHTSNSYGSNPVKGESSQATNNNPPPTNNKGDYVP